MSVGAHQHHPSAPAIAPVRRLLGRYVRLLHGRRRARPLLRRVAVTAAALLAAASAIPEAAARDQGSGPSGGGPSAVIRYTENGIPHILARDYAHLGFGTGWAQAADQVCVLAEPHVVVAHERHTGLHFQTIGSHG